MEGLSYNFKEKVLAYIDFLFEICYDVIFKFTDTQLQNQALCFPYEPFLKLWLKVNVELFNAKEDVWNNSVIKTKAQFFKWYRL